MWLWKRQKSFIHDKDNNEDKNFFYNQGEIFADADLVEGKVNI